VEESTHDSRLVVKQLLERELPESSQFKLHGHYIFFSVFVFVAFYPSCETDL
jgi:hypothetical protein